MNTSSEQRLPRHGHCPSGHRARTYDAESAPPFVLCPPRCNRDDPGAVSTSGSRECVVEAELARRPSWPSFLCRGGRKRHAMTTARTRIGRRLAVPLLAVVVLLAGCSRDLGPTSYTSEVQSNYMQNCAAGSAPKLSSADATLYCECTYKAFVDNVQFGRFRDFETYLRQHVGDDINSRTDLEQKSNYGDIVKLFDGCLSQGAPAPTATAVTTVAPATAR